MSSDPTRHLHRARAPDQLQDLVDQDRDDGDVEEIPPAHRWAAQYARQELHHARIAYLNCRSRGRLPQTVIGPTLSVRTFRWVRRTRFGFGPRLGRRPPSPARHGPGRYGHRAARSPQRPRQCPSRARSGACLRSRPSGTTCAMDRTGSAGRARRVWPRCASAEYECAGPLGKPEPGIEDHRVARQCRRQSPARARAAAPPAISSGDVLVFGIGDTCRRSARGCASAPPPRRSGATTPPSS